MTWQGVEIEIQVPCAEGKQHPVRLRFTGWGEYEVVHNPCEELLGAVFARMAPCTHYLREQFPEVFRQDARFRKQLVEALGKVGVPAVPLLIQALGDGDWHVREAACRALGEIGDRQAVPPLIQALRDGSWQVCRAACWALGQIGAPQAVPHLIQNLGNQNMYVRLAAGGALVKIGRPAVLPLIQALGDGNEYARFAVCWTLGQIGDPQALPHLIQALEDEDEYVRWAAREAVEQIKAKQCARNKPLD
jgi:HEAT repeat protein